MSTKRVLMIVTSHAQLGDTGKPTGLWAEELAVPYFALRDAGVQIDLASPAGGAVPLDPVSLKPAGQNEPAVERLLSDEAAQRQVTHARKATETDGGAYDAVFLPGGHGTMWDLPADAGVTRAVEAAYAAGKLVAAVCHGPAGLVSAKKPNGEPLVQGLKVNAFTNDEEDAVGLSGVVPFALETRLRELGGRFEHAANWQPHAVRDGQLITGQNPMSSGKVAQLLLEALSA